MNDLRSTSSVLFSSVAPSCLPPSMAVPFVEKLDRFVTIEAAAATVSFTTVAFALALMLMDCEYEILIGIKRKTFLSTPQFIQTSVCSGVRRIIG